MATAAAAALVERVMSVDVECVANGFGHNDRTPSWVAVVDAAGAGVYKSTIAVANVVSYLTPITGQKPGDLDGAPPFAAVQARVKAVLGPDVVLVGQGIAHDVAWLGLAPGADFARLVDLADTFRAYNPRFNSYNVCSLRHAATTLLGEGRAGDSAHDPEDDARVSVRLYHEYTLQPARLPAAHERLVRTRPAPSVAKALNYACDGVCMAKFFREKCTCGQP